ncbi:MAG TPA: hypothetical protein IAB68_00055 [Candidatus Aphodocola excrementigallinarum]|uniref:Thioredoxin domain-containing protein n=1 Tax=Candidatus Aphodocola excrementigallinarum TaxID=2840670 RepID=A0A9D1IN80_9FIRM|nr:hypothetical protein [Candidatus Aphodocola excrementigallinarum]
MKKLVAVVLTFLLILTGCDTIEVTKVEDDVSTDSIRFKDEYSEVSKDNIYEYATYYNVIDTIENETGIIYLGFSSCTLCKEIVPVLDEAAKDKGVKRILYYDFKDIRDNNTQEYQDLAELLSDYINEDDEGNKRITAPTVIFVNKGNIVGVYIGTINSDNEEIITDEQKNALKDNFSGLIDKMLIEEETTSEETA